MDCHSNPLVSVIVPVYNASQYLAECVHSLLEQSYHHLEILLINDGSTDGSLSICRQLAQKDSRVVVLSQKNSGASSARNCGLNHARGYWIVFVDSDDVVKVDYICHLVEAAILSRVDFVVSGLQYWDVATDTCSNKAYPKVLLRGEDLVLSFTLYRIYDNGGPCSKLYKGSILREHAITFNEDLHFAEDCDFMLKFMRHIDSMCFVADVDYVYRLLPTSLSHRKLAVESEEACIHQLLDRFDELQQKFKNTPLCQFKAALIQYFLRLSSAVVNSDWNWTKKMSKLKQLQSELRSRYNHESYYSYRPYCLEERIHHFLLWYLPPACIVCYKNYVFPLLRRIVRSFS